MIIGTVRPEEAKVFDSCAGHHNPAPGVAVEVFWSDGNTMDSEDCPEEDEAEGILRPGWYWWACSPGCLPDGEANGPFASSRQALSDATPEEDE